MNNDEKKSNEIRPIGDEPNNKLTTPTTANIDNDNSKAPDPDTTTHIAAGASTVRDAKDAASKANEIANGGGTPIANMHDEAQIVALTTLARSLKTGAIDEGVFIEATNGVPRDNVKAALLRAGVPLEQRKRILETVSGKSTNGTRITADASTVRNAKDAAGKVDEIAKGGGTPIADMQPEAQVVALTALAGAMKGNEPSVSEEEFIEALRNVPYKRAKKALKAAGTPAATREHILEKVYGKK